MEIIWRRIPSFDNYEISEHGEIRRVVGGQGGVLGRRLSPKLRNCGYIAISLSKNGKVTNCTVHRLIAETFLGPCPEGKEVNHKDGNKLNNYVSNLEYVTRSENRLHAYRIGIQPYPTTKLTLKDVRRIIKLFGKMQGVEIAAMFNVTPSMICAIKNGRTWKRAFHPPQ